MDNEITMLCSVTMLPFNAGVVWTWQALGSKLEVKVPLGAGKRHQTSVDFQQFEDERDCILTWTLHHVPDLRIEN